MLFPALDTILKEKVFRTGREVAKRELDLFVVNTFGSASQAVFVFMLLPVLTYLRGMSFAELPQYLSSGESSSIISLQACIFYFLQILPVAFLILSTLCVFVSLCERLHACMCVPFICYIFFS